MQHQFLAEEGVLSTLRDAVGKVCTNDEKRISKYTVGYQQEKVADFGQADH